MDKKTLPPMPKYQKVKVLKVPGGWRLAQGNYRSVRIYQSYINAVNDACNADVCNRSVDWETKFKQSQKKRVERYGTEVRGIHKPKSQHEAIKRFVQKNYKHQQETK